MESIVDILKIYRKRFRSVVPVDWQNEKWLWLDLSRHNASLRAEQFENTASFDQYICEQLSDNECIAAVGGYDEERIIYQRSAHFAGQEPRCVHLGIDVWMKAGTPVCTPLDGVVHSVQDNVGFGDYGPTIILKHTLLDVPFYTLYGHLSRLSLAELSAGMYVGAGTRIADIGPYPENGDWPPHLHFQIITDMGSNQGDFPGVVTLRERQKYLNLCPDPNLILQIPISTINT